MSRILWLQAFVNSEEERSGEGVSGSGQIAWLTWERGNVKLLPFPPHVRPSRASGDDNVGESVLELTP
jgi:hypothetical protein